MKLPAFLGVLACCFVAAIAAVEVDHWMRSRPVTGLHLQYATPTPVDFPTAGPADFTAAAKKVLPSVVSVDNFQQDMTFDSSQLQEAATGSGVILTTDGVIVTNNHVVANASEVRVRLSNHKNYVAKVLGVDRRADLAILKIDATDLTPIEIGDSAKLQVGQWVMAVGNPLGYDQTVSVGVVSNKARSLPTENGGVLANAIQTDAAINPGNSGGALTDAGGRLIGINSAIISPTGSSIGIGFAIPVDRVTKIAADIVKYGHSREGFLGIAPDPRLDGALSSDQTRNSLAQAVGVSADQVPTDGVIVPPADPDRGFGVISGMPADKAGIRPLDVILSVDGQTVSDHVQLLAALANKSVGDSVNIKYWSRGKEATVSVTLIGQE